MIHFNFHSWSVFQIVILNQFKHHKENVFDQGIVFNLNIKHSNILNIDVVVF